MPWAFGSDRHRRHHKGSRHRVANPDRLDQDAKRLEAKLIPKRMEDADGKSRPPLGRP